MLQTLAFSLAFLTLASWYFTRIRRRKRCPPGPQPLPILGNMFEIPTENAWETYAQWKEEYGDIIYLEVLGAPMVILNSSKACNDLLEKRSSIYSDRPRLTMINEIVGWSFNWILMKYGPRWHKYRRLFSDHFNQTATKTHIPLQQRSVHEFLRRVVESPEGVMDHLRFALSSQIMEIVYGIKAHDAEDPYIKNAEKVASDVFMNSLPGNFLVDTFPILKYIPWWVPGATFKKKGREWNKLVEKLRHAQFDKVKKDMEDETAGPSITASILSQYHEYLASGKQDASFSHGDMTEEDIMNALSIAHPAGSDTTISTIRSFLVAMANYPSVQRAAQAELDSVVGSDRLPIFDDMPLLSTISAIIKEASRRPFVVSIKYPLFVTGFSTLRSTSISG